MSNLKREETPMAKKLNYTPTIGSLLTPRPTKASDRRSWGIPVAGVWVPFFTATNATGESHLSTETLGYPVRLAKDGDGSIKLTKNGAPALRTVKELADQVRMVRENFQAGLLAHAEAVQKAMPEVYKAQADANAKAGRVVYELDKKALDEFLAEAEAQAQGNSETPADIPAEPELVAA